LQRLSTEDGPGIRTTVFFKGCPLHCRWCHNPESISPMIQVQWLENRCIGCLSCIEACPQHGLSNGKEGITRDRVVCTSCGTCVEVCPSGAMEQLGTMMETGELAEEVLKDRVYFEKSGGGVTLSGGEPALQADFSLALIELIKAVGVSTALDTCGLCSPETLEKLVSQVDLVLFDLKIMDSVRHAGWTGVPNERIIKNLLRTRNLILGSSSGKKLWVRTPLIPRATDDRENIKAIGRFLARELGEVVERWELCAFNNLCQDKYRRLGLTWDFAAAPLMGQEELNQCGQWATQCGLDAGKVFVTGAVRTDA
jgi:pyruvate formate lyase activating enzyme